MTLREVNLELAQKRGGVVGELLREVKGHSESRRHKAIRAWDFNSTQS